MSKRHVEELARVYDALFEDAVAAYPTLVGEFEKDRIRLRRLISERGIYAYCVDLPAAGKHLDRCLAAGAYKLSGLPFTGRVSKRVVIPKFLRGLYLRVFDESGTLKENYDVEAIYFLRQFLYCAKKVELPCSNAAILNEVEDFSIVDSQLPIPEGIWAEETPDLEKMRSLYTGYRNSDLYRDRVSSIVDPQLRGTMSLLLRNLDIVSGILTSTLGDFHPQEWRFRHGPGAISERTGPTNKYYWSNWSERLENVFPIGDYGFHSYPAWADRSIKEDIGSLEPCSRLIAVPKTFTKPRLIAAEPSEHQWCQQNLWHYFDSRVDNSWLCKFIRFRDQTHNQALCKRGSEDGSLTTVDLSAASDRVTCHNVGQFFRVNPRLLLALQSTRTRYLRQDINPRVNALIELRKFSTMGSACTFPVQSLVFLGICLAVVATKRHQKVTPKFIRSLQGSVAVFGDDLIIPTDCRELLFSALEVLHFKVNLSKSFWTGLFRESCGVDAFGGVNVTPVYWRSVCSSAPESIASAIEVRNNFYSKFLLRTAARVATTIPLRHNLPNVSMGSGVCGFKSRVTPPLPRNTRWSNTLHRMESRVLVFETKNPKTPVTDDSALLQYFTERPPPTIHWSSGVAQRPKLRLRLRRVASETLVD